MRIIVTGALLVLSAFPHTATTQGPGEAQALRAQLASGDWTLRRTALVRLAPLLKLEERPAEFLPLLDDAHYQVRETAIELLYGTRDSTLVEPLLRLCADAHPDVREAAVGVLHTFAQPQVATAVAERARDARSPVRRRAIAYFKLHDSAIGRAALVTALKDEDALNRLRAVEALAVHRATEASDALCELVLRDPDPRVRREAGRVFMVIDSHLGLLTLAKALASERDASVRSTFAFTLEHCTHQDFGEDSQAWVGWLSAASK